MANIQFKCLECGKTTSQESYRDVCGLRFTKYTCGHTVKGLIPKQKSTLDEILDIEWKDNGKICHPFPFQAETIIGIEKADFRAIVNHEMGLGKTPIALITIKRNLQGKKVLILCPAGLTAQWQKQAMSILREFVQVLTTDKPYPDFDLCNVFICSVDSFWRLKWMKLRDDDGNDLDTEEHRQIRHTFEHIITDEVQYLKNSSAKRAQAVKNIAAAKKVITLSGTPVENHAGEYFVPLHIVRPDLFPTEAGFLRQHVGTYWNGYTYKIGGLRNPERFKLLTEDFIFRKTRDEVMPELPKKFRQFRSAEMKNKEDRENYEAELEAFLDFMDERTNGVSAQDFTNILSYFSRMRHLTGLSKVEPAAKFAEEFLLETNRKLVIYVHHKDVHQAIKMRVDYALKMGGFGPSLEMTSEMSSDERSEIDRLFFLPENRILVASTLASGTGRNWQCCSDCLFVERQWNPAKEEQAEDRFPRPGNTADKINATYLLAAGTIDDMFTELVERKRAIKGQVIDYNDAEWSEASLMKELMNELATKGRAKWKAAIG